jgi:protein-tyrosine phosphatase
MAVYRVLFVCMGNICRSPTAHGVFERVLRERAPDLEVEVDSAGTHDFHVGLPPDPRSIAAAARRGLDLRPLRARLVGSSDFERFDLIVAMDRLNRAVLLTRCPAVYRDRVRLLMEFAGLGAEDDEDLDVPDPYYGGELGFERVLDLVEEAAAGLLEEIRDRARASGRLG